MTKKALGVVVMFIGLAVSIAALFALFGTNVDPGPKWIIFYSVTCASGLLVILLGIMTIYDSRAIPSVSVPPPAAPHITKNDPWRGTVSFRYMEELKKQAMDIEKEIEDLYQAAVEAQKGIPQSSGRIEYNSRIRTIRYYAEGMSELEPKLKDLKARIGRLFNGDVDFEL